MNGSFLSSVHASTITPTLHLPRGTGSFHQVSVIYIFIDTNVCFLSARLFKCPATLRHVSWGKGQGGWKPLRAETPGLVVTQDNVAAETLVLKVTGKKTEMF